MADTTETKQPDYLGRAAGSFGLLGGMTPDIARRMVLDRVGVPQDDPLRAGIADTHPGYIAAGDDVLPDPFPPEDYQGPLVTGQDYLNAIASTSTQKAGTVAEVSPAPPQPVVAPPIQPVAVTDAPKEQE